MALFAWLTYHFELKMLKIFFGFLTFVSAIAFSITLGTVKMLVDESKLLPADLEALEKELNQTFAGRSEARHSAGRRKINDLISMMENNLANQDEDSYLQEKIYFAQLALLRELGLFRKGSRVINLASGA